MVVRLKNEGRGGMEKWATLQRKRSVVREETIEVQKEEKIAS
jgi:hypothetical protein